MSLQTIEVESVKKEILLGGEEKQVDPELLKQAESISKNLLAVNMKDPESQSAIRTSIEGMCSKLQMEAGKQSAMLKAPIATLSKKGEDGGPVAKSLVDLKIQVEELDPGKFDFEAGWLTRTLGFLPFIGTPLKAYFTQYESASTVIDAIIRSLEDGGEQLKRDNITLQNDQNDMRSMTLKLQEGIKLGQLIDKSLSEKLETELTKDDPLYKFVADELLFPLRQRIQDLQQLLAVNQQGILTVEIVIRNNKELIRGVNRAASVTVQALQVAVTLSLALANQKIVLEKINAVNETTNSLIASTAEKLKTQGADIHKQASETMLDMDVLKQAFADINSAMDDISEFRQQALPTMAQNIIELDSLTEAAEKKVQDIEKAKEVASSLEIEIL
ncbi:hypothetical protein A9Q99_07460 [Gammaproteobacteria bacterium 45_16_T64]|nr:hypothetical protein A9Q99_07460 [Gammaproteobacteria bacterium 45_16_T64]